MSETLRIIILRHPVGETGIPQLYKPWLYISIDDFFLNRDGVFKFDARKIQAARDWAYNKAVEAIRLGVKKILVDNTNTNIWEFQMYLDLARKHGGKATVWKAVEVAPSTKVTQHVATKLTTQFYTNYEPWKEELLCRIVEGKVQLGTPPIPSKVLEKEGIKTN